MKACKIILIFLLSIWSLWKILSAFVNDDEQSFEKIIEASISIPTIWMLFWGAGILDL